MAKAVTGLIEERQAELGALSAPDLVRNHDEPNWYAFHSSLRGTVGRDRLDEPFLVTGANRDDDLIGRERCESIANRETDVCFPGNRLDRLTRKPICRALSDQFRMSESFFVIREPVQRSLSDNRHDDFDLVGVSDVCLQHVVSVLDSADDQNFPSHNDLLK